MCGQVVRGIPLDAANIRCGGDGRPFLWEMSGFVGFVVAGINNLRIGDDVDMMEEYPEDFLGDIDDFVAPNMVRSRRVHLSNELGWLGVFRLGWISKISQDAPRPVFVLSWRCGCQMDEEQTHNQVAGCKLAWSFPLLIEQHAEKGWE